VKKYLTISYILLFSLLYNNSFCSYSEEQMKKYEEIFKFGVNTQIGRVLDEFKLTLSQDEVNASINNLFTLLFENNNDPDILKPAIFLIGEKKIKALSPTIAKILNNPYSNPSLRSESARALGRLKDLTYEPSLISLLKDPTLNSQISQQVIFALGELKSQKSDPILKQMITSSKDDATTSFIIDAMKKIKNPQDVDTLVFIYENPSLPLSLRQKAAQAMSYVGGAQNLSLIKEKLALEQDANMRFKMLQGLIETNVDTSSLIKDFNSFLKNSNADIRVQAIAMLPQIALKQKAEFLKYTILNDAKEEIQEAAAVALMKVDLALATQFFKDNIEKGSTYTQTAIISALGKKENDFSSLFSSFFPSLYLQTTNPIIRYQLVQIASQNIDKKQAFTFLKNTVLIPKNEGIPSAIIKDRILALQTLSTKYYSEMLPYLKDILENPYQKENLVLFNTSLTLLARSKSDADAEMLHLIQDIDKKNYKTLQRSDIYNQLSYMKPQNAKEILIKNYKKEVDPQVKFQIKRLLSFYGVNLK
jgi:HEAT repeat protein